MTLLLLMVLLKENNMRSATFEGSIPTHCHPLSSARSGGMNYYHFPVTGKKTKRGVESRHSPCSISKLDGES